VRKGFDIATLNNNYDAKTVIANTYDSIMPEGMVKDAVKDLTKELLPVAQEFVYAYITEIIIESVKNAVNKKG